LPRYTWATARDFYFIAAVALESKAALGLAISYKATEEIATIFKGAGVVSGLSSWDRRVCRGWGNSWQPVGRVDATSAAIVIEYFDPKKSTPTAANTTPDRG